MTDKEKWNERYPPKKPQTLDDYMARVLALPRGEFKPHAFYNVDGDQLEVYWDNESDYGTELKGQSGYSVMCVMKGQETHAPVGVKIYSIKHLLKEMGLQIVPIYYQLTVVAKNADTEIWVGDEWGDFVQKATGFLDTMLRPGKYIVQFDLGTFEHVIELDKETHLVEAFDKIEGNMKKELDAL